MAISMTSSRVSMGSHASSLSASCRHGTCAFDRDVSDLVVGVERSEFGDVGEVGQEIDGRDTRMGFLERRDAGWEDRGDSGDRGHLDEEGGGGGGVSL